MEDAINDADKANADYKYFDIHRVKILSNMKKPMKDNPFLDSFSDSTLRSICSGLSCLLVMDSYHSSKEEITDDSFGHLNFLCSVGEANQWNDRGTAPQDRISC